jgi:2-C-methyl-D-erythritol 2,4-cyclodiphosphate synthase
VGVGNCRGKNRKGEGTRSLFQAEIHVNFECDSLMQSRRSLRFRDPSKPHDGRPGALARAALAMAMSSRSHVVIAPRARYDPVVFAENHPSFPVFRALSDRSACLRRRGNMRCGQREVVALELRVGHGHDTHRLARGRSLILGGVRIEFDRGLIGHSDADVLLHAIVDSLFGAAGLGDIGEWFPDTDPKWAGADSGELLKIAVQEIRDRRWTIVNLDCTIAAEKPRLSPHRSAIRQRVAELLGISPESVNVKAKTGEGVGPVGRQEAIMADAVVLLARE